MFPILKAEAGAYSQDLALKGKPNYPQDDDDDDDDDPIDKNERKRTNFDGEALSLVSGYQSLNNHRASISGSMELCSNEFMVLNKSNRQFCYELIDWTFHESGELRATNLRHHKQGTELTDKNPENYELEDTVVFEVDIEQKVKGNWHKFIAEDV